MIAVTFASTRDFYRFSTFRVTQIQPFPTRNRFGCTRRLRRLGYQTSTFQCRTANMETLQSQSTLAYIVISLLWRISRQLETIETLVRGPEDDDDPETDALLREIGEK